MSAVSTKESNNLYLQASNIDNKGVFSHNKYCKGDFISHIHGEIHVFRKITPAISKKMLNWIGVGRFSWINTDKSMFRFINHSCQPNVAIKGKRTLYAIQNIAPDTELVMDYSLTEAEPGWGFVCNCKSEHCRKNIGPIWTIDSSTYRRMQKYISAPFKKIYANHK